MPGLIRPEQLTVADFERAYALLRDVTPLTSDCGNLCGKMCCHGLEEHAGMYLFPGEEALFATPSDWYRLERHASSDWEFCPEWRGTIDSAVFLECTGECPRHRRPLVCRLFPLAADPVPVPVGRDGQPDYSGKHVSVRYDIDVVVDVDAALMCPLARRACLDDFNPEFVSRCKEVFAILARDPLILADLYWQAQRRREDGKAPWMKLLKG